MNYFSFQGQHALGNILTKYNVSVPFLPCHIFDDIKCGGGQYIKGPNQLLDVFDNDKKLKHLQWLTSDQNMFYDYN